MKGLSVIVPAYNEEGAIVETLRDIGRILSGAGIPHEILVVDDCSTDGTVARIMEAGGPEALGARLLRHEENRGYGASIKTASRSASYDVLCITDSDGTYPNARIPDLYKFMEGRDMVVGARVGKNVHIPLLRRAPKAFINALASYVAARRIPDLNSGLRVFTKELFDRFFSLYPDGFSLTSTITLAALTNGYRVKYEKIDYFKREGSSKIKPIKDTLNFVMLILRMCVLFNPLRVFIPLTLAMVAAAAGILVVGLAAFDRFYDGTFITLSLSAVQFFCMGLIADAISRKG